MPKEETKEEKLTPPTTPKASTVAFTPEQMALVQQLIAASKDNSHPRTNEAISLFTNIRDPKEILSIRVWTFGDGKFVIGLKDFNLNQYRKVPRYYDLRLDINRKLADQPFIGLLLSDGKKDADGKLIVEEKELSLIDYMNNRQAVWIEKGDFTIEQEDKITDYGILGRGGASNVAVDFDDNGQPVNARAVKAETFTKVRTYLIKLPGFDEPVTFTEDFLA